MTKDYIVLGSRVKLNTDQKESGFDGASADEIVDQVRAEAEKLKMTSPHLDDGKIFLLVALKMAGDKRKLETEIAQNIKQLESSAADALQLIEDVTPTTFS